MRLGRDHVAESACLTAVDLLAHTGAVIDDGDLTHPRAACKRPREVAAHIDDVSLQVLDPRHPRARAVLRAAMADLASSYYQRQATDAEIEAALAQEGGEDLASPRGLLVLATDADGETTLGCAGLRLLAGGVGEVRKVYVAPLARGRGMGQRLVEEVERLAVAHGCTRVRLDTRGDLLAARRLYARLGYDEVEAFNTGAYAEHWFAKDLPPL